jgi:hypothetical protein
MIEQAAIKRATLAAHRAVEELDSASLKELKRIYAQAAEDVAAQIRAHAGGDDTVTLYELRSLLDQLETRLRQLSVDRNAVVDAGLDLAARLGAQPFAASVDSPAAMRAADEALRFVRNFVAEDGLQLSDRIWRLDRGARDTLVNAIEQAVIQGHGAAEAARDFLSRGQPVPLDVQARLDSANAPRLARGAVDQLLTGQGNPLDNAMRLMRTELNRAHGEAYMMSGEDHPDFAGWRFLLSPAHPEPDICDLLSAQNLHGLGQGVYPSREKCPWPAHPNTLSFLEIVFKDEITDADRQGQETPLQALARLTAAQRAGVLGQAKAAVYNAGQLTQGMIRAPWRAVKKRIGQPPPPAAAKALPKVQKPRKDHLALDEIIALGNTRADALIARAAASGRLGEALPGTLLQALRAARTIDAEAKIANGGKGADLVRAVSRLFPDDWTQAADRFGPLYVRGTAGRAWHITLPSASAGRTFSLKGFRFVAQGNDGLIAARDYKSALHEYSHRLQHALPALDDYFQDLHQRRTAGDPLKRLRDLIPGSGYASNEVTREDKYIHVYQGKIYSGGNRYLGKHGAMEVITMAFESVFGNRPDVVEKLVRDDREMFNLVLGVLFHYVP